MKKQLVVTAKEQRRQTHEDRRRAVEATVDAAISRLDAGSTEASVLDADSLIAEGGKVVEASAVQWMSGDLQGAIADVSSSAGHLARLAAWKSAAEAELSALPACAGVQMVVAVCYIVGAMVAFFTELKLTDALVDLLGYHRNDPTGRAIGAAFAAAMLVFDLIFTRLALVADPWPLFQPESAATQPVTARRWVRAAGGVAIVLTLLAIAWLQVLTVIKMAPTRPIDADLIRDHRGLTVRERQIVEDSTLLFSVCVLVSGGFMAAAGTKELSLWLRRRALATKIRHTDHEQSFLSAALDKTEMPALAGEMEKAGVPSAWLSTVPPAELASRLKEAFELDGHQTPGGIRMVAAAQSRMFEAAKRIDLSAARKKPAEIRTRKSWRETVDEVLVGEA